MRYINLAGYIAIPLAYAVHLYFGKGAHWEPYATFILAALGVIPLAHLMGHATEHLAEKTGPTWGGLLNATFGNAAELIIAIIALSKGLTEIVKASLTGSILGNLLLVGGASMIAGGWKRKSQTFSSKAAEANAGLLAIATAAMLLPAIFDLTLRNMHDTKLVEHEHSFSMSTSIVLLIVYALGLLFTLHTHKHILSPAPRDHGDDIQTGHAESWSVKRSITMLLLASVGIGLVAELLVGSAEHVAENLGWSQIFIGVVLLAIIGNAAEHSTAVMLAINDDMDTAMTIVNQSSLQIALFVTPGLVILSWLMVTSGLFPNAQTMDLMFTPMEVIAVVVTVATVIILSLNGETNWFEGALLLALYAILSIGFFLVPASKLIVHGIINP